MSREIKFRAWDRELKRMWWNVQDAYDMLHCHYKPDHAEDCDCADYSDFDPNSFGAVLSDDRYVVMQFTGLLDKNGKEIYEGDIVRFDNTDIGGTVVIGEIMFNQDTTLANLEWGLWTKNGYLSTDFLGWIEILGNVYENPELVEK